MINNLSSSFSKWRKDGTGPGGRGHNSSNLSDRSALSTMSYVSFNDRSSIMLCPPIPGLDQPDGVIGLTPEGDPCGDDFALRMLDMGSDATKTLVFCRPTGCVHRA